MPFEEAWFPEIGDEERGQGMKFDDTDLALAEIELVAEMIENTVDLVLIDGVYLDPKHDLKLLAKQGAGCDELRYFLRGCR